VYLVCFIIRICHDARSHARKKKGFLALPSRYVFAVIDCAILAPTAWDGGLLIRFSILIRFKS
jgi:hypothetical protein